MHRPSRTFADLRRVPLLLLSSAVSFAARGFRHPHFVPGQLFLMDDDVVGFLWLPIGTFVVFSRVPEEDEPDANAKSVSAEIQEMVEGVVELEELADEDEEM